MAFNSEVFIYLSRAMRASICSIIFTVVSTPTSDVMSTSSKSSSTSASTVERPATARANFEKKPSLVFCNPADNSSFCACSCLACCSCSAAADSTPCAASVVATCSLLSFFFLKRSKNPIIIYVFKPPTQAEGKLSYKVRIFLCNYQILD